MTSQLTSARQTPLHTLLLPTQHFYFLLLLTRPTSTLLVFLFITSHLSPTATVLAKSFSSHVTMVGSSLNETIASFNFFSPLRDSKTLSQEASYMTTLNPKTEASETGMEWLTRQPLENPNRCTTSYSNVCHEEIVPTDAVVPISRDGASDFDSPLCISETKDPVPSSSNENCIDITERFDVVESSTVISSTHIPDMESTHIWLQGYPSTLPLPTAPQAEISSSLEEPLASDSEYLLPSFQTTPMFETEFATVIWKHAPLSSASFKLTALPLAYFSPTSSQTLLKYSSRSRSEIYETFPKKREAHSSMSPILYNNSERVKKLSSSNFSNFSEIFHHVAPEDAASKSTAFPAISSDVYSVGNTKTEQLSYLPTKASLLNTRTTLSPTDLPCSQQSTLTSRHCLSDTKEVPPYNFFLNSPLNYLMDTQDNSTRKAMLAERSASMREFKPIRKGFSGKRITLLGLFEMTTRAGERSEGRSELAAARMAINHINQQEILPGYQLELLTNDTKCDPGVGVDTFFHALYTQKTTRMVMLLGTACSDVTESIAKVVPYWNIIQVSFGSTSPALSDRQEFPLFYRTVAPDSSHNPARLAFVRGFGWDTVTALSQNEDVYSLAVNDLVTELEQANITCRATITFAESDFKDQLRTLRDLDTRIIIGSFSHLVAPKIFCEAYNLGMYGSDYAWILQGGPSDIWWDNVTECPQHHLAAAVEGLLLVSSHNSIVGDMPSYSGLTNTKFQEEFDALSLPVTRYAPQTYDAVWAIALALQGAQRKWKEERSGNSVHHFDYIRRDMAEEYLAQLGVLDFLGVSGPVSFSGADRVGISAFYQVQGGDVTKVALFYPSMDHMDFSCPDCKPLVWQGGQVPIAKRVFKLRVVTIEPAAFLSITCLALVGITLAFAFLAFNLHFRKLKYIKLSSPRLNNMAVVGCILVYTAVILLGLDNATLPANNHFPIVCTARVYLLSAGFSLAFGSMFTKTYRVHRIFTRSHSGVVKNKLLQDTQLISLICVLLLIDGLIVTLWVIIDPIQRHLRNLTLEISATDRSVVYQPQVEVCRSQYTHGWLGALYGYKGLLLIVGVYMAWETRHVKIPALNDSQYIGMSVYSVVITSGIVVVLANLISERATLAFVTITTLILTSTTATLCLLFLPKLHAILGNTEDNGDPIMHSMGLKFEYNTRRFVTDDRRELYYRVEVQNRVYQRELAALDIEIGRLKRQLSESPRTSTESICDEKGDPMTEEKGIPRKSTIVDTNPSPSIGSGLPMLLLSVLPPVIPRASWPSAEHGNLPMRRQVTFSSEPKLDDTMMQPGVGDEEDEYYTITCEGQDVDISVSSGKQGVFRRLKNFLGSSKPSSRKTSTASFSGTGIASALKLHMGYLAGIVPNTNANTMTSSCSTSVTAINQPGVTQTSVAASAREVHPLKHYCSTVGGGSGPIISVTSNDDPEDGICFDDNGAANRRKFSLAMCLSRKEEKDLGVAERRVSYSSVQKGTIQHQHSQPVLSFRERAKGSPRFPHKIVPTYSLNALEDRRRSSSSAGATSYSTNPAGSTHLYSGRRQSSHHHLHVSSRTMGGKCRSLEDATSIHATRVDGAGTSCASLGISNWKPRAASYSPNCDVWGTAEFGIPLSELANSNRCKEKNNATTAGTSATQRRDSQCSQNIAL